MGSRLDNGLVLALWEPQTARTLDNGLAPRLMVSWWVRTLENGLVLLWEILEGSGKQHLETRGKEMCKARCWS